MRAIYIRHADKSYGNINNVEYFKHDPGITEVGVERTKSIASKLIEIYGEPTLIVSSPYRRTRETALVMNSMLKKPLEEIAIDIGISEYLGNHNHVSLDVTHATLIHSPPHPETFEQMKARVKKHARKLKKFSKGVVWFISHGLIIKQIAALFNIKTSKQLPYLTCFSFVEKDNIVRGEFLLFRDLVEETELKEENKSQITKAQEKAQETKSQEKIQRNDWKEKEQKSQSRESSQSREQREQKGKFERVFIPPDSHSTGRDDISGRINKWYPN